MLLPSAPTLLLRRRRSPGPAALQAEILTTLGGAPAEKRKREKGPFFHFPLWRNVVGREKRGSRKDLTAPRLASFWEKKERERGKGNLDKFVSFLLLTSPPPLRSEPRPLRSRTSSVGSPQRQRAQAPVCSTWRQNPPLTSGLLRLIALSFSSCLCIRVHPSVDPTSDLQQSKALTSRQPSEPT